jgi:hypothetical protein
MAAPNIVNVTTITGKSINLALTTSAQELIDNTAGSGTVLKVNTIIVTNVDGTNACDLTINYYTQDDLGGTAVPIVSTLSIPADSSVVVIDKNSSIYLEEDRGIGALASANSDLVAIASWEEIS